MRIFKPKNKAKLNVKAGLSHQITRDPYVDWTGLVVGAVCVAIFLVVFGILKYSDVIGNIETGISNKEAVPKASIDTQALDRVIREFELRQSLRFELERGYSGPADPSV